MAATAIPTQRVKKRGTTSSKLVQQLFQWDSSHPAAASSVSEQVTPDASERLLSFPKKSRSIPSPAAISRRTGRCEQVGGLMETVLSRYGISAEEFRQAVDELRASRAVRPRG